MKKRYLDRGKRGDKTLESDEKTGAIIEFPLEGHLTLNDTKLDVQPEQKRAQRDSPLYNPPAGS